MIETYDLSNPDKPTINKDPQAVLDYGRRWNAWLALANDTILSASVAADAPLQVQGDVTVGDGVVSAMIGGGTPGQTHRVTFTVNTSSGRTDQRSIFLRIKDR